MVERAVRFIPLIVALGCGACIDNGINGRDTSVHDEPDINDPAYPKGDTTIWPPIQGEYCNGLDDDGDDLIDEGFPDLDGDGVADCVDEDCDVSLPKATDVGIAASCSPDDGNFNGDPWDIAVEWRWAGLSSDPTQRNILTSPVVGNLTDDDGDGRVDRYDIPEIVFIAFADTDWPYGPLVALDGETGAEVIVDEGPWMAFGGIVLADVDGDGQTDVVGFDAQGRPHAVRADMSTIWRATRSITSTYPQATVADLDGDGHTEVIADNLVLDGRTGKVLVEINVPSDLIGRMPAVGDVDLDGKQEFMIGQTLYELGKGKEWSTSVRGTYGHWAAIIDADGDAEGEIAVVGDGRLVVHDPDGTVLVDVRAGTNQPGPPCAADFDGDGVTELAWGSKESFNVYELDGTRLWTFPMSDQSGLASCSGYDFDADGSYEVLFADEQAIYIFDGATGKMRYANTGHASGTVFEYPVIADVDHDGSAEVVLASSNYRFPNGWSGITVFGQVEDGWARSGTTWHVHDFAVTNISEDGIVPAVPVKPWQVHNLYRARPSSNDTFVDLQAAITDVCYTGCKGPAVAKVAVQVYNTGSSTSRSRIPVALYAVEGELQELLAVQLIPGRVPAGRSTEALVFEVPVNRVGRDGLLVRVNDTGGGAVVEEECDYDNNEGVYTDVPCL